MTTPYDFITDAGHDTDVIMMIHGMSQDRRLFDKQVAHFRQNYKILNVDLPGHGAASNDTGPFGPREFTDAMFAAMNSAGVTNCHLWGTHTGASIGLIMAAERPDAFRSMILESPVIPGHAMASVGEIVAKVKTAYENGDMDDARQVWWKEGPWFSEMHAHPIEHRAQQQRDMITDFNGGPWINGSSQPVDAAAIDAGIRNFSMPVLLMTGEHDVPDFLEAADILAGMIPKIERCTVPNAGGFALWEEPKTVNQKVGAFLSAHMR